DPENTDALSERAGLAQERGDLSEAESCWRKAAARAPYSREIIYNLSVCLQQAGKRREADAYVAKLKGIDAALKRLDELTRKIAERPHDPSLRHEIGIIF